MLRRRAFFSTSAIFGDLKKVVTEHNVFYQKIVCYPVRFSAHLHLSIDRFALLKPGDSLRDADENVVACVGFPDERQCLAGVHANGQDHEGANPPLQTLWMCF